MKISSADNQLLKATASTSDVVPVVFTKSKPWLKPIDRMDAWLDGQGFYRKHIARDASSLFRCVSEVVFVTQLHHLNVRRHCIHFALYQPEAFKKLTNMPVKDYVERLSNPREYGTTLDMEVMSLIYGLDFAVYKEIEKPLEKVTNNGFNLCIILSMSYEHHYDSVYPKQHIMDAAICQSILYEILYKHVFKLEEVDYAVNKMLHDKSAHYQAEWNMAFFSSGFQMRLEMRDNCKNVKDLLNYGITPFPYKVAKALDPNIYRNVEYDTWNEQRKSLRHLLNSWNDKELQVGSRCLVNFNENNHITKRHGYIQQMSPNKGPVVVYVEELGEKLTVPFETLELIPVPSVSVENNENTPCKALARLVHKDNKSLDEKSENLEVEAYRKMPAVDGKSRYHTDSDLCNVHYAHPTPTAVPSTCYACITSQTFQSEVSNVKKTHIALHSNEIQDRPKRIQESATVDQSASISMQYSLPIYPVVSPDMSGPQTVMPTNFIPSKTLTSNEYIDNSSVRMVYNRSLDSYYKYGYSTYPYYVVPPGVIYSTLPSDQSIQQNIDTTRVQYSYPMTQVHNEMMYGLPMAGTAAKTELPMYPTVPLVHPSTSLNLKNSITMATGPSTGSIGTPYPVVSSNVCPVTYSSYTSPMYSYYPSYEYYVPCPDVQPYENVTSPYPVQSILPITYSDETYPGNAQIYCQTLLPVNHAQ